MLRSHRFLVLFLVSMIAWSFSSAAETGSRTSFQGSYWYVVDHVTDVAEDAEITLVMVLPPDHGPRPSR